MKLTKFCITVALTCVANIGLAQVATVGPASTNAGAVATFDSHNVYEAPKPVVASAFAPALAAGFDTCMGSTSGAVSSAVIGIAMGSTYVDVGCEMRKDARELWNMGQRAAALARTCMSPLNREALELTGYECPQTANARIVAKNKAIADAAIIEPQLTDPYIRARKGLAPLPN